MSTVLVAAPSQAAVINGSFESGDFTGWEEIGIAAVGTNAIGVDPTDGIYQAGLVTVSSARAASIEGFLGLTGGSLSTLGNGVANGGAAIKQTFTASAGDVVSFD